MIRFNVKQNFVSMKVEKTSFIAIGGNMYDGSYEIIPTIEGQTLATKHKTMQDDLTVKAIPRYDVSNSVGGTTIYIANEV